MNHNFKILMLVLFPLFIQAQQSLPDSLENIFTNAINDSVRYETARSLYSYYEEANRDSALYYAGQQLQLSKSNHKNLAEVLALDNKAYQLTGLGHYAEALQCLFQAFEIAEDKTNDNEKNWALFTSAVFNGNNRLLMLAFTHHIFAVLMWQTQNSEQEIFHFKEARRISEKIGHNVRQMMADMNLGRAYLSNNEPDSALIYEKEAEQFVLQLTFKKYQGSIYAILGDIFLKKNDKLLAKEYYYKGIQASKEQNNLSSLNHNYFSLAKYYLGEKERDSALLYARKNLLAFQLLAGTTVNLGTIYENIYRAYQLQNKHDSVFKYQTLTLATKDSLYKLRIKNLADFQNAGFREQLRLQDAEKQKIAYQAKVRTYALIAGLIMVLLVALILYRNNRQKHQSNKTLQKTLSDLKDTQSQLIQSEKMASLGELTAGIAHEIQNPLNFVNNFSDVNKELIEELDAERLKPKAERDEQLENEILNDIKVNEAKINHHGKRADAIVKGMLQHSRSSSGQKELTDINALADEYLRLSYHGLRAKDKTFNAIPITIGIKTDFDTSLPKINIVPQDIGRVLLNLINNAFYAVNEKKKTAGENYEPEVVVSTKKDKDKVEIKIEDNGNGIPQNIVDKIFQPFFTTKPTGQGTGLGLSLAYDITKSHGGEIKVITKEGEGSAFIIQLPMT